MNGLHPSDMELQQYVLDKIVCPADVLAHVDGCADCQAAIAVYGLLFGALEQQPRAEFNFDAAALVMERVMEEEAGAVEVAAGTTPVKKREDRSFSFAMAGIIAIVGGIPAWLFRKNAFYVFTGVSAVFLYLMVGAALMFVVLRIVAMYRKYQRRMQALQFY